MFKMTPTGIVLSKGEEVGMFLAGSTIVVVAECPPDYDCTFDKGQKFKMGQELFRKMPPRSQ